MLALAAPVGLTPGSPDFGVFLYISYEHYFLRKNNVHSRDPAPASVKTGAPPRFLTKPNLVVLANDTVQISKEILFTAELFKEEKALLMINIKNSVLMAATAVAMLASTAAQAGVDMFLDLGSDIPGESTDKAHPNQVDVFAWSWGMSNSGGALQPAGKVNVQDISFTKWVDKSSPKLMLYCASGKHIPTVTLTVRRAGENQVPFLTITLTDVVVSSISTGGTTQDRPTENVSFNFGKVKVTYTPVDAKGNKIEPVEFNLNISDTNNS